MKYGQIFVIPSDLEVELKLDSFQTNPKTYYTHTHYYTNKNHVTLVKHNISFILFEHQSVL